MSGPARRPGLVRRIAAALHVRAVRHLFRLFERLVPVRDDTWCFCTWDRYPHTLDNPRAVFEAVKDDPAIRKVILQKVGEPDMPVEGVNVRVVPAESVAGAWALASARVILLGYALRGMASYADHVRASRHHVVQLWHGIPLKRIARLFPGEDFWEPETSRYAALVCSAERDREIMAAAFAPVPPERVWLSGLPRNDLLLQETGTLPADYRDHLEELERQLDGRRLVLYAPTWRERTESLYVFGEEEERALERVLTAHDAVLGIRGHANVRTKDAYTREAASDCILSVNDLPDVNVALRRTDVLVTDYSSIYIDFLLLDRPVVHFAYDLDDYVSERGFLYELDEALGGACVQSFDDLIIELEHALSQPDHHRDQRERARALFHSHGIEAATDVSRRIRALPAPGATPRRSAP